MMERHSVMIKSVIVVSIRISRFSASFGLITLKIYVFTSVPKSTSKPYTLLKYLVPQKVMEIVSG